METLTETKNETTLGPICPACERGDHDVYATADHQLFKCACACNHSGVKK